MPVPPRFSDDDVRAIRQSSLSARALAREYDVTHATISNIRDRRTYKHVPDHLGEWPSSEYHIADALSFLKTLPDGYCETIVIAHRRPARPPFSASRGDATDRPPSGNYTLALRELIPECIRVAGPSGAVFYLHSFVNRYPVGMNIRSGLVTRQPLRQVIVVNYPKAENSGSRNPGRRMRMLPHTYDVIFMFTGQHWSVPEDIASAAAEWGDVWHLETGRPLQPNSPAPFTPEFPEELAIRCIALSTGRVLIPNAASGTVILAAIKAGRDWLACDTDESLKREFERRLDDLNFPASRRLI